MSRERRSRLHRRMKASPGAYSDRFGPRAVRRQTVAVRPVGEADPWITDWPAFGIPALLILPDGTVIRRR